MSTTSPSDASMAERECPEHSANIFSRILLTWLTPILVTGYRRPLQMADLYRLGDAYSAQPLFNRFIAIWSRYTAGLERKPRCPLFLTLSSCFGTVFYSSGLLKLLGDVASLGSPALLSMLIRNMTMRAQGDESATLAYGYGLCIGIFALQMLNTLSVNVYFRVVMLIGLKLRTCLTAAIYQKSLRLSAKARQEFSTGQIVNLMSTDAGRIDTAAGFLHYVWSGPVQVIIAMTMLFLLLQWAAFAGLALFLVFIPIQARIMGRLSNYRKQTSAITDRRVRLMQEIIQGIRAIKFYAWESSFLQKLEELRAEELVRIRKTQILRAGVNAITIIVPVFACIAAFVTYSMMGYSLTAAVVFPALSYFTLLRLPLILLPMVMNFTVDAYVATRRIQKYLLAEELDFVPLRVEGGTDAVVVSDATFEWEMLVGGPSADKSNAKIASSPDSADALLDGTLFAEIAPATIHDIDFRIPRGSLVAIVGPVGSGKSSILSALVGEMKCIKGTVAFGGTVAYCPQQAWIQNATFRANILFGLPYDAERYWQAITACALEKDLAMLPDGDQTEIGEKGINLSGGQKQRVSLARAVYRNADIILLDDVLSAVDAHVGGFLFDHCINGCLSGKTRLLVTHQLHFVPYVDYVIVMEHGRIVEEGKFADLMHANGPFAILMRNVGGLESGADSSVAARRTPSVISSTIDMAAERPSESLLKPKGLITAEERAAGSVASSVYVDYIRSSGGAVFVILAIGTVVLFNGSRLYTDLWLSFWASTPPKFALSQRTYIVVYVLGGVAQGVFSFISGFVFALGGVYAAIRLHSKASKRVLHAPASFFDTNPTGRIINRFSKDQDTVDNLLSDSLRSFVTLFAMTAATFLLMIYASWYIIIPLLILLLAYYYIQRFYRATSRELKRLDALSRSPLYSHFSETLTGLPTIRAFADEARFGAVNFARTDLNNQPIFLQILIQRWLGIRLETVGNGIILGAASICYWAQVDPALAGLAIGYALSVTGTLNWCVRQIADTESQIISSERLGHYAYSLITEAESILPNNRPDPAWPADGAIEFRDVVMQYRPELEPVLKQVCFTIKAGERVGIVGRTGAGKSSIMMSLFRLVEPSSGSIVIDGVDISTLGLSDLRTRLAIIPQDPVIFSGSIRTNLDPFGGFTDQQLWAVLEKAHLRDAVIGLGGLESSVQEGGENLSVGQRQLLCLARAMLRMSRVLVLDEATANIDLATDALIQRSIQRDFQGCTILTIAHRLNTVINYDRILVMSEGRVAEFDSPEILLADETSMFSAMVRETGEANQIYLKSQSLK